MVSSMRFFSIHGMMIPMIPNGQHVSGGGGKLRSQQRSCCEPGDPLPAAGGAAGGRRAAGSDAWPLRRGGGL